MGLHATDGPEQLFFTPGYSFQCRIRNTVDFFLFERTTACEDVEFLWLSIRSATAPVTETPHQRNVRLLHAGYLQNVHFNTVQHLRVADICYTASFLFPPSLFFYFLPAPERYGHASQLFCSPLQFYADEMGTTDSLTSGGSKNTSQKRKHTPRL